jgi:hypothetical protein
MSNPTRPLTTSLIACAGQEFGCQMREPADSGDGTRHFAWMGFRAGNDISKFDDTERRSGYNEHGVVGRKTNRGEVMRQLERHIGRQAWQGHECGQHRYVERVSIWRSLGCNSRSDGAGSPGMIDGHDLLTPNLTQSIRNHPKDRIGRAAGSRVRDDCDQSVRLLLGLHSAGSRYHGGTLRDKRS